MNGQTPPPAAAPGLPEPESFIRKVRDHIKTDPDLQTQYTYRESRRDVKVSKLGKVTLGPLRTFEVYPSNKPGRTYKRLVSVDGKPLDPAELARRDQAHRDHVIAVVQQEQNESPELRTKRFQKEAKELQERRDTIDDGFAIYEIQLVGRETLGGLPMIVATLTPRPNAKTKTDVGKWMKKFRGRAWVSESDFELAKLDVEAIDDISIGLGLVGRVHKGSRFIFTRTKVNNEEWLPAEARFEASGRTLLFRKFRIDTITQYSNYKKHNVDTSETFALPKDDDHR